MSAPEFTVNVRIGADEAMVAAQALKDIAMFAGERDPERLVFVHVAHQLTTAVWRALEADALGLDGLDLRIVPDSRATA